MLTIEVERGAQDRTLVVTGELDLATAPQLRQETLRQLPMAQTLYLDLAGVSFMGVAGVHVLTASQRRAALLDKRIVLARTSTVVDRLLELTGASALLPRRSEEHYRHR